MLRFIGNKYEENGNYCVIGALAKSVGAPDSQLERDIGIEDKRTLWQLLRKKLKLDLDTQISLQAMNDNYKWLALNAKLRKLNLIERVRKYAKKGV